MKKLLILLILVCFCFNVFATSEILEYKIPSQVNVDQRISATGFYSDGNNPVNNIKCSFYFLDDNNVLVSRATDEYTTLTGRFVLTPFLINEPTFLRGKEYTLRTECNLAIVEEKFFVGQRSTIAHLGTQEFEYLTNPENIDTFSIWFLILIFVIVILLPAGALLYYVKRK